MNQTNTSFFLMGLFIGLVIVGSIFTFLQPEPKDNIIGDYLRYQDDKIASQSADIVFWKGVADTWKGYYFEENRIRIDMQNFLTDEERWMVLNSQD